jgi:hypothetical protein
VSELILNAAVEAACAGKPQRRDEVVQALQI